MRAWEIMEGLPINDKDSVGDNMSLKDLNKEVKMKKPEIPPNRIVYDSTGPLCILPIVMGVFILTMVIMYCSCN